MAFAPWFAADPGARVHGAKLRMTEDEGRAVYLGVTAPERLDAFADGLLASPMPGATRWEERRRGRGMIAIACEWREPIYPGVHSPMWVASRTLGPGTLCGFTITQDTVRHRILSGRPGITLEFWQDLRAEMERFARWGDVSIHCELERLAAGPGFPADPAERSIMEAAWQTGHLDQGDPRAGEEVAFLLGVPSETVRPRVETSSRDY